MRKKIKIEKIVNLTPFDVSLILDGGEMTIPKSGRVAKVINEYEELECDKFSVMRRKIKKVENLPPKKKGVFYIVSPDFVTVFGGRGDLLVPAVPIENEKGIIVGCKKFVLY